MKLDDKEAQKLFDALVKHVQNGKLPASGFVKNYLSGENVQTESLGLNILKKIHEAIELKDTTKDDFSGSKTFEYSFQFNVDLSEKLVKEFDARVAREKNPDAEKIADIAFEVLDEVSYISPKVEEKISRAVWKDLEDKIPYSMLDEVNVEIENSITSDESPDRESLIKEAKDVEYTITVTLTFHKPYLFESEIEKSLKAHLENNLEL